MAVKVAGIKNVERMFNKYGEALPRIVKQETLRSALAIQTGAKKRTPVDTGRLRNSIAVEMGEGGFTASIGTNVAYAKAIEFGGKIKVRAHQVASHVRVLEGRAKAQKSRRKSAFGFVYVDAHSREEHYRTVTATPYLFPAFEEERPKYRTALARALKTAGRQSSQSGEEVTP